MTLHQVLQQIAPIIGENFSIARIPSALTNASYHIKTTEQQYSLRLNSPLSHALGINREREKSILTGLSEATWCVDVMDLQQHWLLSRWVRGRPFHVKNPSDLTTLTKLQHAVHHQDTTAFRDSPGLNIVLQLQHLLTYCQPMQADVARFIDQQCTQYKFPAQLRLCFHDWHAGNIISNNHGLTLIDWEYAALGDPIVDVACLISGFKLSQPDIESLLATQNINPTLLQNALCLTELMSLLWFHIRFPHRANHSEVKDWMLRWHE